jgi:hypothetical protein
MLHSHVIRQLLTEDGTFAPAVSIKRGFYMLGGVLRGLINCVLGGLWPSRSLQYRQDQLGHVVDAAITLAEDAVGIDEIIGSLRSVLDKLLGSAAFDRTTATHDVWKAFHGNLCVWVRLWSTSHGRGTDTGGESSISYTPMEPLTRAVQKVILSCDGGVLADPLKEDVPLVLIAHAKELMESIDAWGEIMDAMSDRFELSSKTKAVLSYLEVAMTGVAERVASRLETIYKPDDVNKIAFSYKSMLDAFSGDELLLDSEAVTSVLKMSQAHCVLHLFELGTESIILEHTAYCLWVHTEPSVMCSQPCIPSHVFLCPLPSSIFDADSRAATGVFPSFDSALRVVPACILTLLLSFVACSSACSSIRTVSIQQPTGLQSTRLFVSEAYGLKAFAWYNRLPNFLQWCLVCYCVTCV